jgi:uncharacterized iron-regulated membrane protein
MRRGNAAWGGQSIRAVRLPILLLAVVVLALVAVVAYAVQRELTKPQASEPAAVTAPVPQRALSAEEEDYAAALWPIHSEVKLAAVEMSFAGIAYRMGEQDAKVLETRLRPLADTFGTAMKRARALKVPPSMAQMQDRYVGALALYDKAAAEMISATRDGKSEHLVAGQQMSLHASEDILRIGEVLWPGEYKPH